MTLTTQSVLRFAPVVVMTLLIAVLSLLPAHCFKQVMEPLPPISGLDKIIHALIYATLTATSLHALTNERLRRLATVLKIALFVTLYGAAIEVCQNLFTTSRSMEMLDISANAAGAFTSSLLIYAWLRHKANRVPTIHE
jgi:VanZ family protein